MFRRFVIEHPWLFRIGVQNYGIAPEVVEQFVPAAEAAMVQLRARVARVLGREVADATLQFHAMCEGLAGVELGCMLSAEDAERVWRDGLAALVAGLRAQHSYPVRTGLPTDRS